MSGTLRKAVILAKRPRMAMSYAAWLGARLTGGECTARLPEGGLLSGFRRFTDYWSLNVPTPAEYELLRRAIRPGVVAVDIGANFGAFTVSMGRMCRAVRIVAFEPSAATAAALRDNVKRNRLGNVEVVQAAVANGAGRLQFCEDLTTAARNHLVAGPAGDRAVWVDAVTIDGACADRGIDRVAFVKIDTEGAETRVVRGAATLLARRRIDQMLMEVCAAHLDEMGSSVRELVDVVEGFGYGVFRLRPDGAAGDRLTAGDLQRVEFENVLVEPR